LRTGSPDRLPDKLRPLTPRRWRNSVQSLQQRPIDPDRDGCHILDFTAFSGFPEREMRGKSRQRALRTRARQQADVAHRRLPWFSFHNCISPRVRQHWKQMPRSKFQRSAVAIFFFALTATHAQPLFFPNVHPGSRASFYFWDGKQLFPDSLLLTAGANGPVFTIPRLLQPF
jgi:hypothetical protein